MSVEYAEAVVAGRVQGVGYREFSRRAAEALDVAGFVRNRSNGTVEARLVGAPAAIDAVLSQMRQGPPGARVSSLTVTGRGPCAPERGFAVKATL